MEELILFIIFMIFSFLRSLGGQRRPAQSNRPVLPPDWPGSVLPQQEQETAGHPLTAGKPYGRQGQRLKKTPALLPHNEAVAKEEQEPLATNLAALTTLTTEEGQGLFQLDRETVLLGLVFSEILREPRSRHRRYRRSDFHPHN